MIYPLIGGWSSIHFQRDLHTHYVCIPIINGMDDNKPDIIFLTQQKEQKQTWIKSVELLRSSSFSQKQIR